MIRIILFLLALQILIVLSCSSQQKLNLKKINKIELYTHDGGLNNDQRKLLVVFEGGNWNVYQTKVVNQWKNLYSDDRIFIKTVSSKLLTQLLNIVNTADTSKDIKLFNIKTDALISRIDSSLNRQKMYWDTKNGVYVETVLNQEQRTAFIKAINNKAILKKSFEKAFIPFIIDHRTYYSISFIADSREELKIEARSFAYNYNLPWYINKQKNYNPNISLIFEFISDNKGFSSWEHIRLLDKINLDIYNTYFKTQFNWSNFKTEQPKAHALLAKTLSPANFSKYNDRSIVYFNSSILPNYVQIPAFFKANDTAYLKHIKKFENKLVQIFKNDNFLFKYLATRSDATVVVNSTTMDEFGPRYLKNIQNYYKDIIHFNIQDIQVLEVYVGKDREKELRSKWMWLPNNTFLLLKYDFDRLKNLPLTDLVSDKKPYEETVCILFDSNGKVVENYGKAKIDID